MVIVLEGYCALLYFIFVIILYLFLLIFFIFLAPPPGLWNLNPDQGLNPGL